jgi:predicted transcriptional regulator of viral defense system
VAEIRSEIRNDSLPPARGQRIARLAGRQHGVVARTQLGVLGLDRFAIRRRVAAGSLHPLHDGRVFAVGLDPLSMAGRYLAAVMACGSGAVLSHRSAADLWGLRPNSRWLEVTATRGSKAVAGVRVHRTRMLAPQDYTVHDGIPVTSVARTLLDLGAVLRDPDLATAIDRAERSRIFDLAKVTEVLDRAKGRRGARALRQAIAAYEPSTEKSVLERRFRGLLETAPEIPTPSFNAAVEGEQTTHEVDAFWPDRQLAIQLDGFEFHRTRRDRERDATSDADLELAGRRVMRLTWDDVAVHAERTLRRLRLAGA